MKLPFVVNKKIPLFGPETAREPGNGAPGLCRGRQQARILRLTGRFFFCYSPVMDKQLEHMTDDELRTELARLKENLCDLEDMHSFTFGKTTVHIGAEQAQNMQEEFEEECRTHRERIALIESLLKARGSRGTS
jgi:hypothetical protein